MLQLEIINQGLKYGETQFDDVDLMAFIRCKTKCSNYEGKALEIAKQSTPGQRRHLLLEYFQHCDCQLILAIIEKYHGEPEDVVSKNLATALIKHTNFKQQKSITSEDREWISKMAQDYFKFLDKVGANDRRQEMADLLKEVDFKIILSINLKS